MHGRTRHRGGSVDATSDADTDALPLYAPRGRPAREIQRKWFGLWREDVRSGGYPVTVAAVLTKLWTMLTM